MISKSENESRPATALEIAIELLDLGRMERRAVDEGRLAELPRFAPRRGELLERLYRLLPAGKLPPGEVRDILRQVKDESRESLVFYCSLRDEIANQLASDRRSRGAVGAYEEARAF